eukprot:scaffold21812_cov110-Isochrysis_galbana.AAC.19
MYESYGKWQGASARRPPKARDCGFRLGPLSAEEVGPHNTHSHSLSTARILGRQASRKQSTSVRTNWLGHATKDTINWLSQFGAASNRLNSGRAAAAPARSRAAGCQKKTRRCRIHRWPAPREGRVPDRTSRRETAGRGAAAPTRSTVQAAGRVSAPPPPCRPPWQ